MDVRAKLNRLLEATAQATALKVHVDTLRAEFHAEAIARHQAEGAAPTWNARGLGTVRLDGADAERKAVVTDPDAFASWVAERRPDVVTATITLPAPALEGALEALSFAGVSDHVARLEVEPAWASDLLAGATVDVEEVTTGEIVTVTLVDEATGHVETLPGTSSYPPAAPHIVITLDPARKRAAIEEAEAEIAELDATEHALAEALADTDPELAELVADGNLTPADVAAALGAPATEAAAAGDEAGYDDEVARLERELGVRTVLVGEAEAYAVVLNPRAYDPATVAELTVDERLTVNRFEAKGITYADLDADQAELRRETVEAEEPALEGTTQLAAEAVDAMVRDRVDVPLPDVITLPPADAIQIVDAAGTVLLSSGDDADAHRARGIANARAKLVALATADRGDVHGPTHGAHLGNRQAAELRELVEAADLGLPKAKIAKAALVVRIREELLSIGLIEAQP